MSASCASSHPIVAARGRRRRRCGRGAEVAPIPQRSGLHTSISEVFVCNGSMRLSRSCGSLRPIVGLAQLYLLPGGMCSVLSPTHAYYGWGGLLGISRECMCWAKVLGRGVVRAHLARSTDVVVQDSSTHLLAIGKLAAASNVWQHLCGASRLWCVWAGFQRPRFKGLVRTSALLKSLAGGLGFTPPRLAHQLARAGGPCSRPARRTRVMCGSPLGISCPLLVGVSTRRLISNREHRMHN